MRQEAADPAPSGVAVSCPRYMEEIAVEVIRLARRSPDVSQRSGVSVRASISVQETLMANAARRALAAGESQAAPRICDLDHIAPALQGKLELETVAEDADLEIIPRLLREAVARVFARSFREADFDALVETFAAGLAVEVGEDVPVAEYPGIVSRIEGAQEALSVLDIGEDAASLASAIEFLLEGLHLNKRLNKDSVGGRAFYRA